MFSFLFEDVNFEIFSDADLCSLLSISCFMNLRFC